MTNLQSSAAPLDQFVVGRAIGTSPWLKVDQQQISDFGRVTLDPDPMHVDPDWAREKGPFGHTVAFGFLTISLLTKLLHDASQMNWAVRLEEQGYYLNYGFDRVRFVSPVPVDSHIRGHFKTLDRSLDAKGRHLLKIGAEIEIEGQARPALIAEWCAIWFPPEVAKPAQTYINP